MSDSRASASSDAPLIPRNRPSPDFPGPILTSLSTLAGSRSRPSHRTPQTPSNLSRLPPLSATPSGTMRASARKLNSNNHLNDLELAASQAEEQLIRNVLDNVQVEGMIQLELVKPRYVYPSQQAASLTLYIYPSDGLADGAIDLEHHTFNQFRRDLQNGGLFLQDHYRNIDKWWWNWQRLITRLKLSEEHAEIWFDPKSGYLRFDSLVPQLLSNDGSSLTVESDKSNIRNQLQVVKYVPRKDRPVQVTRAPEQSLRIAQNFHRHRPPPYMLFFRFYEIQFFNHPLMNEENRLVHTVWRDWQAWNNRAVSKHAQYFLGRIQAHQRDLEKKLLEDEKRKTLNQDTDNAAIRTCLKNLAKERAKFEKESRSDRELEWRLLQNWNKIKQLRAHQVFSSTALRVLFEVQSVDPTIDKTMEEYVCECLSEERLLWEMDNVAVTHESVTPLQPQTNSSKEATNHDSEIIPRPNRRRRRRSRRENDADELTDDEGLGASEAPTAAQSRTFPQVPQWNETEVSSRLKARAEKSFMAQNKKIVSIIVANTEFITPDRQCPPQEQARRAGVRTLGVNIKIVVNGKPVMSTSVSTVDVSMFHASFSTSAAQNLPGSIAKHNVHDFAIELREESSLVSLEVWQRQYAKDVKLTAVDMKLPDAQHNIYTLDQEIGFFEFADAINNECNGSLKLVAVWDVDANGEPVAPVRTSNDVRQDALLSAEVDVENVENERPIVRSQVSEERDFFSLKKSGVSNMLQLNLAEPLSGNAASVIVSTNLNGRASPTMLQSFPAAGATSFLAKVRSHELYNIIHSKRMLKPGAFDDFVREERLSEKQEASIFKTLLRQRRPLRPERSTRSEPDAIDPTEISIVAQVIRGINIPVRSQDSNIVDSSAATDSDIIGLARSTTTVRTYVEMQFQRKKQRTSVVEGSHPQWNETLVIPFKNINNAPFKVDTLQSIDEHVFFNIFDEFTTDLVQDDRDRDIKVHRRREVNWLGTLSIPFSSIYSQKCIEGKFHVLLPELVLGYEKERHSDIGDMSTNETMIHLFMTIEPVLPQPAIVHPPFESSEDEIFISRMRRWKDTTNPDQRVPVTAIDLKGKATLVPRFITPQAPPPGFESVEGALRCVSMIPYIPDRSAFWAALELWSSSEEMLQIGAGDETEHAILLCNYFKFLGLDAFVILGSGIPEGNVAYVMVAEQLSPTDLVVPRTQHNESWISWFTQIAFSEPPITKKYVLYNPLTGCKYLASDSHCPLRTVSCAFNDKNIWANIKKDSSIGDVKLNTSDASCWRPFVQPTESLPRTIQSSSLDYRATEKSASRDMERSIHQQVTSKIEKLRGRFVTKWNRSVMRVFDQVLPELEEHRQFYIPSYNSTYLRVSDSTKLAEVRKLQSIYRIRGFSINIPWTDMDAVVEAVCNTDVHANYDTSVEFVLSVHCCGYFNDIYSVWVYVASLTKTR